MRRAAQKTKFPGVAIHPGGSGCSLNVVVHREKLLSYLSAHRVTLVMCGFFTNNFKFFRMINSHLRNMVNKPLPQKSKDLHFPNN